MLTLFLLVLVHFVADWPLQSDFIAKAKSPWRPEGAGGLWFWALTAHASTHALGTYLVTRRVDCALFVLGTHWIVDLMKCRGAIGIHVDQILHLSMLVCVAGRAGEVPC